MSSDQGQISQGDTQIPVGSGDSLVGRLYDFYAAVKKECSLKDMFTFPFLSSVIYVFTWVSIHPV